MVIVARAASADPGDAPVRDVPSAPPARTFVPTVGVGLGGLAETAKVDVFGAESSERRGDTRAVVSLGLSHRVVRLGARARLDGHAQIGLGPTFFGGRYQVPLREDVTFVFDATSFLGLRAGLGLGVVVDATRASMSYGEVGVPVGATFFDAVEIVYRPYLGVPLSSDDRATFGGTRDVSAALAVVPFDLTLRFRISALGF
jgi:hypothetical protein